MNCDIDMQGLLARPEVLARLSGQEGMQVVTSVSGMRVTHENLRSTVEAVSATFVFCVQKEVAQRCFSRPNHRFVQWLIACILSFGMWVFHEEATAAILATCCSKLIVACRCSEQRTNYRG